MDPGSAELADISSELQLWPLVSLQPLDQNQCLVPHLKDLFHICLETKVQGFWMTFNICNLSSKYPYFNRAYVVSSGFGCTHLYVIDSSIQSLAKKTMKNFDLFSFERCIFHICHILQGATNLSFCPSTNPKSPRLLLTETFNGPIVSDYLGWCLIFITGFISCS